MFAVIDRDGSGTIDLQELQEHVNSARAFADTFGASAPKEEARSTLARTWTEGGRAATSLDAMDAMLQVAAENAEAEKSSGQDSVVDLLAPVHWAKRKTRPR